VYSKPLLLAGEILAAALYNKKSNVQLPPVDAFLPVNIDRVQLRFDLAENIKREARLGFYSLSFGSSFVPLERLPRRFLDALAEEKKKIEAAAKSGGG
jgi:hypothetical protein